MNEYDYENPNNKFEKVGDSIWINKLDNTFHFVDETENFQGPYLTFDLASVAYFNYVKWLNGEI